MIEVISNEERRATSTFQIEYSNSLFGDKISQNNENHRQESGDVEQEHTSSSSVESHSLPFLANTNENQTETITPIIPNNITGQEEMSILW